MMNKFFTIIFVAGLVVAVSVESVSYNCRSCHKKIDGARLEVDGNYYHPNHFVCFNCLKPISETLFFIQDERYYDSACFATFISKRCDFCGKSIIGESVIYDSKTYHHSCYNESVGSRCVVCGNVVLDEFFVDKRGGAVCKSHKDDAERCSACQLFLSPIYDGSWEKYDDGRIICKKCLTSAVTNISEANKLMSEVKDELARSGIIIDKKFKLLLVSINDINRNLDHLPSKHLGVTVYEKSPVLGDLFSFKRFEIHVLYGLPKSLLRSVLAHELMHVWQFSNAPQPQDHQMCEGTCQYASFLILQNDNTEDGKYFLEQLLQQDDEIYGKGYNYVSEYIGSVGLKAWLNYLKKNKNAPW